MTSIVLRQNLQGNVTGLDKHVRANEGLYDRRPELRDYILSDAYKDEFKGFEGVVEAFQAALLAVYPAGWRILNAKPPNRQTAKPLSY